MKILVEVGGKVVTYEYPDDSRVEPNKPMHGWINVSTPEGKTLAWFQVCYLIAMLP